MSTVRDERSIGDLFGDLTRDLSALVHKEVELARVEISNKVSRAGVHVAMIAVAAVVACAGLYTVIAAVVLGAIELGMAPWASALVVGIVVLAIGGLLAQRAISALKREDLTPEETVRSLKETAEWAKQQTSR